MAVAMEVVSIHRELVPYSQMNTAAPCATGILCCQPNKIQLAREEAMNGAASSGSCQLS